MLIVEAKDFNVLTTNCLSKNLKNKQEAYEKFVEISKNQRKIIRLSVPSKILQLIGIDVSVNKYRKYNIQNTTDKEK